MYRWEKSYFVVFNIFVAGVISLSSLRKPDLQADYTLNVSVTDGVFTAFTRVMITVQNSNNHAPTFPHAVYDMDITENTQTRRRFGAVTANDADLGIYGDVIYDISSEDMKEYFMIDQHTGMFQCRADCSDKYLCSCRSSKSFRVYTLGCLYTFGSMQSM